jgi:putative regulator of septum formation
MTTSPRPRYRFVCPPNWPQPPVGWTPPAGWQPDPAWGPAPASWSFWQPEVPQDLRPPVDGLAVTALVTGAVGAFLFSIIFGIVSLGRIRRGERRGRGLVLVGWGLCVAWIIAALGLAWLQVSAQPQRAPSGSITAPGKVSPLDIHIGDCLRLPADGVADAVIVSVEVMPCAQPHNAQVFEIITLDADAYPGTDEITRMALDACEPKAYEYLGDNEVTDLRLYTFVPPKDGWQKGDRSASCLLFDDTGDFTGEARDHG